MRKYILYIGSNNETKVLESDKANTIVSKYYDGFTTSQVTGYWKGSKEDTLKVEIVSEKEEQDTIATLCEDIKRELQQEAVMVDILASNTMFI